MDDHALPTVLILTPVKDAASEARAYVDRLLTLDYPADRLSLGMLASDSVDGTPEIFADEVVRLTAAGWASVTTLHRDFGYRIPDGLQRWDDSIQLDRRRILALSRNHLLFGVLRDQTWVLWLDVDVVEYRTDIVNLLVACNRDIVQPHCVLEFEGPSFDLNAWVDHGRLHMQDLRGGPFFAELHAVGGAMLMVRADRHRDGLIWPAFRYGLANERIRTDPASIGRQEIGEIETEGLAIMANDMGITCWGLPYVEIRHQRN